MAGFGDEGGRSTSSQVTAGAGRDRGVWVPRGFWRVAGEGGQEEVGFLKRRFTHARSLMVGREVPEV